MTTAETNLSPSVDMNHYLNWLSYCIDTFQRSILLIDTIRKRGNTYLDHLEKGQPPALIYNYEVILKGADLERPVNYSLARILDRRKGEKTGEKKFVERRDTQPLKETISDEDLRPIVIVDPRAGHGPGIGGSKEDSEIGMALNQGHAVYFLIFTTYPEPDQTLGDVENAMTRFFEEVKSRHPRAPKPAIIGNCQGGWAAAIVGADRPDLVGPLLLNGSPLSYWSGVEGKDPMRYKGGLLGGVWINSFLSDLGNGYFDGANLVLNFELLNPANTYWKKFYNLYRNVDSEEARFLNFEKWWGGFFILTQKEIHQIVSDLFIGNKLVKGTLTFENGRPIDLKKFNSPVIVFSSQGDNITPPQQALNWIPTVYQSVDEIKRHQQVIVYIVHPEIGHLGIFVSSSIAKKEQREIIGSVEMIDYLAPGLYEMVIEKGPSKEWKNDYTVRFEERSMRDILALDDSANDEKPFRIVAMVSEKNDKIYQAYIGPWVKIFSNEWVAGILKELHPLRMERYMMSDLNPFLIPLKRMAPLIRENRVPISETNPYLTIENNFSKMMTHAWTFYRDVRDQLQESIFQNLYDTSLSETFFNFFSTALPISNEKEANRQKKEENRADRQFWLDAIEKGGYTEGVIRVIVAMMIVDKKIDEAEILRAENIILSNKRLYYIKRVDLKIMVKEQARILQTNREKALKALPVLLKTASDRQKALRVAKEMVGTEREMTARERSLIETIEAILA